MLAFEKITEKDFLIAQIYESETSNKVIQNIYFVHRFSGDSQIVNDDIVELLQEEQLVIQKEHNITLAEYMQLCEDLKNTKPINPDYPRNMKKAYLYMNELVGQKLKRELVIPRQDSEWLRDYYDTSEPNTAKFRLYVGSSGSGKTYALVKTVLGDKHVYHYTNFYLIGTTGEADPAYEPLRKYFGARWHFINSEDITEEQTHISFYTRSSCIVFDDTTSTVNRKRRRAVLELQDRLLTTARHRSIKLITVHHRLNSYRETSKARNSTSTWCIFPRTIPASFLQICDKNFGMKKRRREALLKRCQYDGRQVCFHMDHPQFLLTGKRIILF